MGSCACAPAPAAYRGGAEHFPPFGRKPQTPDWPAPPQSGYSPRSGSPRPCEQSVPQLPSRPGVDLGFDASSHRTAPLLAGPHVVQVDEHVVSGPALQLEPPLEGKRVNVVVTGVRNEQARQAIPPAPVAAH